MLKTVGERLTETLRSIDTAGRWGGEEFLLVAPDVNLAELEGIAERCRVAIASCRIPVDGKQVGVTVSVGAALLKRGESDDSAVKRADELLYIAKCQGRQCGEGEGGSLTPKAYLVWLATFKMTIQEEGAAIP